MPTSELSYKSADGTQIVAYKWDPEDDRGVDVESAKAMFLGAS